MRGELVDNFHSYCGPDYWCTVGAFFVYTTFCTLFCMLSGFVVRFISPQSAG